MEEMTKREKVINYLTNKLNYAYCDNCNNSVFDDETCEDCHRKYQNWCLSVNTAAEIADTVLEIFKDEENCK